MTEVDHKGRPQRWGGAGSNAENCGRGEGQRTLRTYAS